jgi:hypothetical protein
MPPLMMLMMLLLLLPEGSSRTSSFCVELAMAEDVGTSNGECRSKG